MRSDGLEARVERAAEACLAEQRYVGPVDVLVGLGWPPWTHVEHWQQGRLECLESVLQVNPRKLARALELFEQWARRRGLVASETDYVARTPDRRSLRFSLAGSAEAERFYCTHWVTLELSDAQRRRLAERRSRPPELVVIMPLKEWTCTRCSGTGDLLIMQDAGPLCLRCAGLDHLVFLPAGDAGLTRRARKASELAAVVVHFSRTRKRYERQGLLVEADALARAHSG